MQIFPDNLADIGQELPADHRRMAISDGYTGTAQTIEQMQKLVSYGKRHWQVRKLAVRLIQNCPQKDFACYTQAIFDYVKNLRYVYDPSSCEYLQSPEKTIELGGGDCDDGACLLCALLESIGVACSLKTIKAKPGSDSYTHVYVIAHVPGYGDMPLDPTMPQYPAGWEAADGKLPGKLWNASLDEQEHHSGGSMSGLALPEALTQYGLSACHDGYITSEAGHAIESHIQTMPSDVMNDRDVTVNFGNLPLEAGFGDVESDTMGGLDCVECGDSCRESLSGLGETQVELSLGSVLDGSAYSELRAAKDESNQRAIEAGQLLTQARASGNAQAVAAANQAISAVARERNSLFEAINKYSQLANAVQTYSLGIYKPQALSGLGVAPAIIATLLAVAAVYALAQAFSVAMAAWRGDANASKTIIQQAADLMHEAGDAFKKAGEGAKDSAGAIKTMAIVAAVGAALFIGYKVLAKRGTV